MARAWTAHHGGRRLDIELISVARASEHGSNYRRGYYLRLDQEDGLGTWLTDRAAHFARVMAEVRVLADPTDLVDSGSIPSLVRAIGRHGGRDHLVPWRDQHLWLFPDTVGPGHAVYVSRYLNDVSAERFLLDEGEEKLGRVKPYFTSAGTLSWWTPTVLGVDLGNAGTWHQAMRRFLEARDVRVNDVTQPGVTEELADARLAPARSRSTTATPESNRARLAC